MSSILELLRDTELRQFDPGQTVIDLSVDDQATGRPIRLLNGVGQN